MNCTKCGNKLDESDSFCCNCGEKVNKHIENRTFNTLRARGTKIISGKIIIFVALLLIMGCVFLKKTYVPAYEKPVYYLFQGVNKKDYELVKRSIPKFMWNSEMKNEWLEEEFNYVCGDISETSYNILGKVSLNEEECRSIEENCEWYTDESVFVSEGYNLKIEIETDGMIDEVDVAVVKIDGKWYLDPSEILETNESYNEMNIPIITFDISNASFDDGFVEVDGTKNYIWVKH